MNQRPLIPTKNSPITKTKVSLFTVLGGAILIAFSIIVGANLWSQYRIANEIIDTDISHNLEQSQALFKTVLNGQLKLVNNELKRLTQQEELTSFNRNDSLETIEQAFLTLLTEQNQVEASDFIVISNQNDTQCHNTHQAFFAAMLDCMTMIKQFDSELYEWHLVKLPPLTQSPQAQPTLVLLTRAPLISPSGHILGHLYGGIVLSGNFSLLNQTIRASGKLTFALGLAHQNHLIASSATPKSVEYRALEQATKEPGKLHKLKQQGIIAMSHDLSFEHTNVKNVRIISALQTDVMRTLQQGIIKQTSSIAVLSILLAVLVVLLTLKLTLTPLNRLRTLAAERDTHPFNPGPILEFQQLSHEVARMLSELQASEQNLVEKRRLLELSHLQQQSLLSRNRKLLHQFFNLQEQERKYLAQELHDELGQPLAVINTDCYLIKKASAPGEPIFKGAESIQQNAAEMADVVYNRIKSLRPMPLNDLGLYEAIRHMPAVSNLKLHGIQVTTDLPLTQPELADHIAIHIFRITQEGLTNVLKHSQASQAWVRLRIDSDNQQPQLLVLEIVDNGIGFDQQRLEQASGYGLSGMVERVHAMNGAWTLLRDAEQNFCIRISINLTQDQFAS
ncbi:MAG: LuxQ periplasmic sensor domain-containing protein [Motiliproteus sp.]